MRAISTSIRVLTLALLLAAPALAAEPGARDIVDCNNNGIDDAIDVAGETVTFSFPGGPLQDTHVLTYFYSTVPDLGPILDVDVGLDITHEWTGYVYVTLRDPSYAYLSLVDRPGHPDVVIDGFGDQGIDVILDDDAPGGQSIETTTAGGGVVTGRLSPYPDSLGDFDGQASQGTWRLAVGYADQFFQGQVNGWSLIFTTTLPVSEDCQGDLIPDECQLVDNDCNGNGVPDECEPDCNENDVADECDVSGGTSTDCNGNTVPDECEPDCNDNGVADACDITGATSLDCQPDGVPDECQVGIGPTETLWDNGDPIDDVTLAADFGPQPADVLTADDIELPVGGIVEAVTWMAEEEAGFGWDGRVRLEIYPRIRFFRRPPQGTSSSANVPDQSRGPVVTMWIPDEGGAVTRTSTGPGAVAPRYEYEVSGLNIPLPPGTWWIGTHVSGTGHTGAGDDTYWVPSRLDLFGALPSGEAHILGPDAGINLFPPISAFVIHRYEMAFSVEGRLGSDCNGNAIPDDCDAGGTDQNENGVPDDCEADCNGNGVPDDVDVNATDPVSEDCNGDATPDECQLAGNDCNSNGVPDECDWDCNDNGIPDDCDLSGGTSLDCQSDGVPDECQLLAYAGADSAATWFALEPVLTYLIGTPWTSDPAYGFIQAEDITPAGDDLIRSVAWYGAYVYASEPCLSQTSFTVVLYASDGSMPGAVLAIWQEVPARATSMVWVPTNYGPRQVFAFQALLDPAYPLQAGETYWLAIWANTGCQGAFAWWESEEEDQVHALSPSSHDDWGTLHWGLSLRVSRGTGDCNGNGLPDDCDLSGNDTNANGVPDECDPDCNDNDVPDDLDIAGGTSGDCTTNGVPDECEPDCNGNTIADSCDIAGGTSPDCQPDGVPDECQLAGNDCDGNDVPDDCEIGAGTGEDCNGNELPDECDLDAGRSRDCQFDGIPDECQIDALASVAQDVCNDAEAICPGRTYYGTTVGAQYASDNECRVRRTSTVWYRYRPAYDGALLLDLESDDMDPIIAVHTDCSSSSSMCNDDFGNLDSLVAMDVSAGVEYLIGVSSFAAKGEFVLTLDGPQCLEGDANGNGRPDACEDCNDNDVFDDEDISSGTSADDNANGIPDECEDCNGNGAVDSEDIAGGTSADCNQNGRPDECDLADGTSDDCNADGIPDDCERRAVFAQAQDDCAAAEPVCPGILYDGSITGASADGMSSCDLPETGADVWYRYIPTSDGELIVGVQDAEFGPLLSIHGGCPGDEINELICDDYRFNVLPQVTMEVTAGQVYWIRIASYEGETGGFDVLLKGPGCAAADLNDNGVLDWYDIAEGTSTDCDGDIVPDECEPDCNGNAVADACDIAAGTSEDCFGNGIPDECEPDCNANGAADTCDISVGTSDDCDANGVPDECQTDSDGDMIIDACEWCDHDAGKALPGSCGCGSPDTDSDGDATADCLDACPLEPALVEPSEPGAEITCDDGIDNDCDGAPDYADYNCVGHCVCGDLNYDQQTDLQDFSTFVACYAAGGPTKDCTSDNLHCCDLDGDGRIDLIDIATFAALYGREPSGVPPDCLSSTLPCPCGDLNRDQIVNLSDFATFALCYGRDEAAPGCSAHTLHCADLNADGRVDLSDFATFAVWYGREPSQVVPNCERE